ncbi:MAG: hypothetical protein A2X01_02670 [Bacteroidetes bacterium GWF2_35_48]|nr:MAG: hypothetical protein A2X01_02670 [Bacteroidetes bacterium GWF2_35_48]
MLIFSIQTFAKDAPEIKNGKLNLRGWSFEKDGIIKLSGEWEFYWNQLLQPDTFYQSEPDLTGYCYLPRYWNYYDIDGKTFPAMGFATYKLNIAMPVKGKDLAVHIKEIFCSYRLYVNGKLIAANGVVAKNKEDYTPEYRSQIAPLKLDKFANEIILQVANFSHIRGGLLNEIELGTHPQISRVRSNNLALDLFMFGAFFIFALYHFGLFFLQRKDKSMFFFGIYALIIAIRTLAIGEQYLTELFPGMSWELNYKFDFLTMFLASPALAAFYMSFLPEKGARWVKVLFIYPSILISLITIFTPVRIYGNVEAPYQIMMMLAMLYVLYVIIMGVIKKIPGSKILLVGTLLFFATVTNDILYYQAVIRTQELLPFGMLIFIFMQAYVISARFAKTFRNNEELTFELNEHNKNLEKLVEKRTQEIFQQKEEIQAQSEQLEKNYQKLALINNELEVKNVLITDSITYAKDIQTALLPPEKLLNKCFKEHFKIFFPRDIVSGDFYWCHKSAHQTVLAVFDCTGHGVPGAFMSMIGNTLLNNIVKEKKEYDPAAILHKLNCEVINVFSQSDSMQDDGMDMSICYINDETKEIKIGMANHHAVIFNKGEAQILEGSIFSIGGTISALRDVVYTNHVLKIEDEISLYMFSDGFIDQVSDKKDSKFGMTRFYEMLKSVQGKPMAEQSQILSESFYSWKGSKKQIDDVLVFGVKM